MKDNSRLIIAPLILLIGLGCGFSWIFFGSACLVLCRDETTILLTSEVPLQSTKPVSPTLTNDNRIGIPTLLPSGFVTSTVVGTVPTNQSSAGPVTSAKPELPVTAIATVFTDYNLLVKLNPDTKVATVSQIISYVNHTTETLRELQLVVDPQRRPGVFKLQTIRRIGTELPLANKLVDGVMHLSLVPPVLPGQQLVLRLDYELRLPNKADYFGYTARQLNFGDWFPFVPPYIAGQGWLIHAPASVGEYLVRDIANHHVKIQLETANYLKWQIAASGIIMRQDNIWTYELPQSRGFDWSLSTEYISSIRTVTLSDSKVITIESYSFPEHLKAGQAVANIATQAMQLYSEKFVPYAHANLVAVEADFADGMEYDGLFFLSKDYYANYDGTPNNYLTLLAAHETAHQWWFGLIGNDPALEPWLDETLATYSELLFLERYYPHLTQWWWQFRVERYAPIGDVGASIYTYSAFRPYVNAVYLRGVLYLRELRQALGEPAFLGFLRDYAASNRYRLSNTERFHEQVAALSVPKRDEIRMRYFVRAR